MITKLLEWKESEVFRDTLVADEYSIWYSSNTNTYQLEGRENGVDLFETLEEAKEAAQQDLEKYVLSHLAVDIKKLQAELRDAKIVLEDTIYHTYLIEGGQP